MMRGELREEIFACQGACGRALVQVEQGIVTEEGKIGAVFPAWGRGGSLL